MLVSHMNIYVFLIIAQCSLPTSLVDPGTSIKVRNTVFNTQGMINKFKEFMIDGRLLRVKANDGCVDAGHHTLDREKDNILTPYVNQKCGVHPWTKWSWDDDYVKVGWTADMPRPYGCLGFWDDRERYPNVDVFSCKDISVFLLRFHPNQFDFAQQQIYFSIHSKKYPSKCLGMYSKFIEIHPSLRKSGNKTVLRDIFQLQECHGHAHQSFYLDSEQFDIIDNLKQKIFGPGGYIGPWVRGRILGPSAGNDQVNV